MSFLSLNVEGLIRIIVTYTMDSFSMLLQTNAIDIGR